jgi:hypothetical protein
VCWFGHDPGDGHTPPRDHQLFAGFRLGQQSSASVLATVEKHP